MPALSIIHIKKRIHSALLHLVITVVPFEKWGIYFMHCRPTSARGHGYIIVAIDYFTKWAEAMPTYVEDGKTSALFLFNHIIARFVVPLSIITNHGYHLCNQMMEELSAKLGFRHENSTPSYLQDNSQVNATSDGWRP